MVNRHCKYIVKPASLVDDDSIPDRAYRYYDKLLVLSWEHTGVDYGPVMLSNSELAHEWGMTEDGARDVIAQLRACKLIVTEQVGRTRRRIRLLVAHRPGKDSRAELNLPREAEAILGAQETAARDDDTTDLDSDEGSDNSRTHEEMPNSTSIDSFNEELKENISNYEAATIRRSLAPDIWKQAKYELRGMMTKAQFMERIEPIAPTNVAWDGDLFVINCLSPYNKEWLENRLYMAIKRTITGIVGQGVEIRYECPVPAQGK